MAAKYKNYWQKLLQEEEAARINDNGTGGGSASTANGPPERRLDYDLNLLPEPNPSLSPRLDYDLSAMAEPLAGPGAKDYRDGDIVVYGHRPSTGST
ncbi:MAG: hypothetical protein EOP21_07955, partial [Hyphomicrobiales bacterium]